MQIILKEFEYQSSLELESDTYDAISHIPLANKIGVHARQVKTKSFGNHGTASQTTQIFLDRNSSVDWSIIKCRNQACSSRPSNGWIARLFPK
jgi:hypothetical protein